MADETSVNSEQFTLLWTKAQPVVAAYIGSLVRDVHDAEDILHEVALVLVRKRDQYDPSQPFARWAIGIAKRQVLKHLERTGSKPVLVEGTLLERFTASFEESTQQAADVSLGYIDAPSRSSL